MRHQARRQFENELPEVFGEVEKVTLIRGDDGAAAGAKSGGRGVFAGVANASDLHHDDQIIARRSDNGRRCARRSHRRSLDVGDADKAELAMTQVAGKTATIRGVALQRDKSLRDDIGPVRKPVRARKQAGRRYLTAGVRSIVHVRLDQAN